MKSVVYAKLKNLLFVGAAACVLLLGTAYAQQGSSGTESASSLETGQAPMGVVPLNTGHLVNGPSDFGALPPSGNGIEYHGGPVMVAPHNIYYIWYGNWTGNTATSILPRFVSGLNGSPYFNTNTSYTQGNGQSVINTVTLSTQISDNYSRGSYLANSDIAAIVNNEIVTGQLPTDPNGVYFVLTSPDVHETSGFCTSFCGWHTHSTFNGADIKFAFVGDAQTQCPSGCEEQTGSSPNGNPGADGMASVIAHELNETVSDPDLNAWYHINLGGENGDLCAWNFGSTYRAPNGSLANVALGGNYYLLQQNWVNAGGGSCAMSLAGRLAVQVDTITHTAEAYFIGTNQHVYELWWNGVWHTADVTAAAGAPVATAGSPLAVQVDTITNTVEAYFIGTNQHVYELWWNGVWHTADVTAAAGAPNAIP